MADVIVSDAVARKVQLMHHMGDGRIVFETRLDAEPVMTHAEFARSRWKGNFRGSKELGLTMAASIPMPLWWELRHLGILNDPPAFQRWLDANPAFKTTEGRALSQVKK